MSVSDGSVYHLCVVVVLVYLPSLPVLKWAQDQCTPTLFCSGTVVPYGRNKTEEISIFLMDADIPTVRYAHTRGI